MICYRCKIGIKNTELICEYCGANLSNNVYSKGDQYFTNNYQTILAKTINKERILITNGEEYLIECTEVHELLPHSNETKHIDGQRYLIVEFRLLLKLNRLKELKSVLTELNVASQPKSRYYYLWLWVLGHTNESTSHAFKLQEDSSFQQLLELIYFHYFLRQDTEAAQGCLELIISKNADCSPELAEIYLDVFNDIENATFQITNSPRPKIMGEAYRQAGLKIRILQDYSIATSLVQLGERDLSIAFPEYGVKSSLFLLNNSMKANELLKNYAREFKFQPDWLTLAEHWFVLFDDMDESRLCLKKAEETSNTFSDWEELIKLRLRLFNDKSEIKNCIENAANFAKSTEDWVLLAEILREKINDISKAEEYLVKAKLSASALSDLLYLREIFLSINDDHKEAVDCLLRGQFFISSARESIKLARYFNISSNFKELLLLRALSYDCTVRELLEISRIYMNDLGNIASSIRCLHLAESKIADNSELINIAISWRHEHNNIADSNLLLSTIFETISAEDCIELLHRLTPPEDLDLERFSKAQAEYFKALLSRGLNAEDIEFKLLSKAEELSTTSKEWRLLGEFWQRKGHLFSEVNKMNYCIKKAEELADDAFDFLDLTYYFYDNGEILKAKETLKRGMDRLRYFFDCKTYATEWLKKFEDREEAIKCLHKIDIATLDHFQVQEISNIIKLLGYGDVVEMLIDRLAEEAISTASLDTLFGLASLIKTYNPKNENAKKYLDGCRSILDNDAASCTGTVGFCSISTRYYNYLADFSASAKCLKKAEKLADSVNEYLSVANTWITNNNDFSEAKRIADLAIKKAKSNKDWLQLSDFYLITIGDNDKASECLNNINNTSLNNDLIQQLLLEENYSVNVRKHLLAIFEGNSKSTKDFISLATLYKEVKIVNQTKINDLVERAKAKAVTYDDLFYLAENCQQFLPNSNQIINLIREAELKANGFEQYLALANYWLRFLGDEKNFERLLDQSKPFANSIGNWSTLANQFSLLNHKHESILKCLEEGNKLAKTCEEWIRLSQIEFQFRQEKKSKNLYQRNAINSAIVLNDWVLIIKNWFLLFDDISEAREAFTKAEKMANTVKEWTLIAEIWRVNLNDRNKGLIAMAKAESKATKKLDWLILADTWSAIFKVSKEAERCEAEWLKNNSGDIFN